jgi:NNP family nitrate/nitrite transporter-like MFS transporter
MDDDGKATRIRLFDFHTPPMRTFHATWFAFFLSFFAWFGIAPLMPIIRDEMGLTPEQMGNLVIASVAATVVARLVVGWLCDRIGSRLTYTILLCTAAVPVMGVGLAQTYETLFWFRLAIGGIGAAFVVTQYHTSVMFAPNCVGAANATTAGWGNLGGGVTQQVMPLVVNLAATFGASAFWGWRIAMAVAGGACFLTGIAYFFLTQDTPAGNVRALRAGGHLPSPRETRAGFVTAVRDPSVWALFLAYGACFGMELTINNVAAIYYYDRFGLDLVTAGLVAGAFGLMNLFARTLGGYFGDACGARWGLRGRRNWLVVALVAEGLALVLFSRMHGLGAAVGTMLLFSLFVQMAEGATFSVVPFVNRRALGAVAGIVGAGGNVGAVAAGFLFRTPTEWWPTAFLLLGVLVATSASAVLLVAVPAERPAREPGFEPVVAGRVVS